MSESARESIYKAIASIRLVDPHTHINPHNPGSQTLADILGYHYYTELIHSAGMPKSQIEEEGISPRELVGRLVTGLPNIENTANYQWLISICQTFFDFQDDRITASNWEGLYDAAEAKMNLADWPQTVLDMSNVEAVFLTNDFDDDLEGFDTNTYIPCLRTDDLVFHLGKRETRDRLEACTGIEIDGSLENLRAALRQRFEHFVPRGARACAISIPPSFQPTRVSDGRAETALEAVLQQGEQADASHHVALSRRVFWTLAELCDEFGLPFDLMIGVNRRVYPEGVYQGQDLYDSRVSLIQYAELFNAFPDVTFPISVLASVTNQELVSYSWIFPNVVTNGHWWYSNTPSFIKRDATARLEAVPRSKQIAYYSDAYKLEFVWAKFDMYRQILSGILADHFVDGCGWSEERAVELGHQILRGNVDTIFPRRDGVDEVETIAEAEPQLVDEFSSLTSGLGLAAAAPQVATQDVGIEETLDEESLQSYAEEEVQDEIIEEEPVAEEPESGLLGTDLPGAGLLAGAGALAAGAVGLTGLGEAAAEEEVAEEEVEDIQATLDQIDLDGEADDFEIDVEVAESPSEVEEEPVAEEPESGLLGTDLPGAGLLAGAGALAAGAVGLTGLGEAAEGEAEEELDEDDDDGELSYEEEQEEDDVEYEDEDAELLVEEETVEEEYEDDDDEGDNELSYEEEQEEDDIEVEEEEEAVLEEEYDFVNEDDRQDAGEEEYEDVEEEDEIEVDEELADDANDAYLLDGNPESELTALDDEVNAAVAGDSGDQWDAIQDSLDDEVNAVADLDDYGVERSELAATIDDLQPQDAAGALGGELSELASDIDLDPLPSDDEIQAVDVDDVELRDVGSGIVGEVESLQDELDPEPLDVGDLLSDELQEVADEAADDSADGGGFGLGNALGLGGVMGAVGGVVESAGDVIKDPIGELESMIQNTIGSDDADSDDADGEDDTQPETE